jgi:hypothetical protein
LVGLQLYREIKFLTQEPSKLNHIESTTLDDGDYELVLEHEQGFSKDPANIAKIITEAPNQGLEVIDIPVSDPGPPGWAHNVV